MKKGCWESGIMCLRNMNCLTALQVFATYFISSRGCEVSRQSRLSTSTTRSTAISLSPVGQLEFSTRHAIAQIKDGVVTLPNIAPSDAMLTQDTKRPAGGATAEFSCVVDLPGLHTGQERHTVLWRHQGRSIYTNSTTANAPFFYSQARTLHAHFLFIHNVSASAAGSVECLVHSGTTTDQPRLVKQFELIPKLQSGDVFRGEMKNISTVDLESSLTCRANINCADGADPYFAWLINNRFVRAPLNHYLRSLYSRNKGPYGIKSLRFSFNTSVASGEADSVCESTMSTTVLDWVVPPLFRIECWVRTHRDSDDWYVQVVHVSHEEVPVFDK